MPTPTKTSLLIDGLADAAGFLVGALVGVGAGRIIGLEPFTGSFSTGALLSLILIAAGGGLGLQLARRWRRPSDQTGERTRSGKP